MSFESHLDDVLAALKISKQQALQNIGTTCVANVQLICPVGNNDKEPNDPHKGNMRRCVTSQVVSENEVDVGVTNESPYAVYVDQGTSKQPAQHFLENGIQQSMGQIQNVLQNTYSSNMGR